MAVIEERKIQRQLAVLKDVGRFMDEEETDDLGDIVRRCLMRTLLKINDKKGERVPFVPNEAQRIVASKWGKKNIVLKARQLGITTYVAARFFVDTITHPGTLTVQIAHDQRSAEDMFRIVHRFQENLPEWLREGVLKTSRSNVRQLRWPHLDCEYRVETAGDPNAGRGMTIRNLHCSEVAMWSRDGGEALVSLRAAVPPDGQVVLESTPNGAGGAFYQEWQEATLTGFVQHFLPWWVEKGYREPLLAPANPSAEELELKEKYGLDDEQLAFRRTIRSNTRGKAAQEYAESPEECFLLSGNCVFDAEKINARLKECEMPTTTMTNACETRDNQRQLVWMTPVAKREYIIGVDTAGGGSDGDYTCAQVIDRDTGMQCAELVGHFDTRETAIRVAELGHRYNDALIVVERNNHGHAVQQALSDRYENTYENVVGEKNGFLTNVQTRPAMIQVLSDLLYENTKLFSSARLLRECRTFLKQRDGSSGAANGAHDDTVMAMAIAQFVRREIAGKRLPKVGANRVGAPHLPSVGRCGMTEMATAPG